MRRIDPSPARGAPRGARRGVPRPGAFPPVLLALLLPALGAGAQEALPLPDIDSPYRLAPLASAALAAPSGRSLPADYSLPMPWGEERFEYYRRTWLSAGGRTWLAALMRRAAPYMPYITERVRYYGLPEELAYLPAIESEFSPRAVSRSGATGLWQFMRNSIAGYGMRIDDWVDERRDFMKSTDAALRKLKDNHDRLGDWELALAAYNAGLGAVSRAAAKAPGAGYWELRERGLLPKETSSYVPKFLAAASILLYPARHGLEPAWAPHEDWAAVPVPRPVDLGILAREAGLDAERLLEANSELRYRVTPPWPGYLLKVPASSAGAARAVLEDPARKLVRYYFHKVASGDTISALAGHYGIPQEMILGANPGLRADLIRIGQVIVVPALKEALPYRQAAEEPPAFTGSHLVARGETLWSLSLRYRVSPELLAERNGLELDGVIREGSSLRVPILQ